MSVLKWERSDTQRETNFVKREIKIANREKCIVNLMEQVLQKTERSGDEEEIIARKEEDSCFEVQVNILLQKFRT